jgi:hypothetical protein
MATSQPWQPANHVHLRGVSILEACPAQSSVSRELTVFPIRLLRFVGAFWSFDGATLRLKSTTERPVFKMVEYKVNFLSISKLGFLWHYLVFAVFFLSSSQFEICITFLMKYFPGVLC